MLAALKRHAWVIAADVVGAALLLGLLSGGTGGSLFATLLLFVPLAFAAVLLLLASD